MDIRAKNNEELLKRIGEVLTDDSKFSWLACNGLTTPMVCVF